MDHLPVPSQPTERPIKVPLRCEPSYGLIPGADRPSHSAYPASQGWDPEVILIGDIGPDPRRVESFLQQWLFFGLIYEIVNSCGLVLHNFDDFVSVDDDDSTRLVTTRHLPKIIEKWQQAKNALPSDQQVMIIGQVDDILADARYFVSKLTYLAPSGEIDLPMDEAILLSIIILGETLEFSKANIFKNVTAGQVAPINLWGNRHILGHLMREKGCCPDHVHMLEEITSASTMYYIYRSGLLRGTKDHDSCIAGRCVAYQIDPQSYETSHVSKGCVCDHIELPMEKIRSILSSGGVPVISFASPVTSYNDFDLDVVEASDEILYVAISHVWSDGLGNPKSNSLPKCQLRELRDNVASCLWEQGVKDGHRVQLWIDTLCVPLDEPLRGRAIELIKTTFENAIEVLVLDGHLKTLSANVDYIENLIRVTCSGWLRRLWTYLEGVSARKLVFQFADGVTDLRVWRYAMFKDNSTQLWNFTAVESSQFYWLLRLLSQYDSTQRVARLWNALQWRSTSRASDETICVASLFGLDLAEILRTPKEKRMRKLLEMQQWFPPGIIFMNAERLDDEGFGWAPKSFLSRQSTELALLNDEKPPTCYNGIGLPVQYPGFLLSISKRPLCATFLVVDKDHESVHLVMHQDDRSSSLNTLRNPAIISSRDPSYAPETVSILVDIEREEDSCKYARFVARVVVRKEQADLYISHTEGLQSEAELEVDEYLYGIATSLPTDQQWCII
jgi:hypothetical protein